MRHPEGMNLGRNSEIFEGDLGPEAPGEDDLVGVEDVAETEAGFSAAGALDGRGVGERKLSKMVAWA